MPPFVLTDRSKWGSDVDKVCQAVELSTGARGNADLVSALAMQAVSSKTGRGARTVMATVHRPHRPRPDKTGVRSVIVAICVLPFPIRYRTGVHVLLPDFQL